jgi:ABC-2 type transport system permease protein
VPVAGLPDGLRQIAELNPLTSLATAMRELFHSPVGPLPDVFTLQHPIVTPLIWAGRADRDLRATLDPRYQRMGR